MLVDVHHCDDRHDQTDEREQDRQNETDDCHRVVLVGRPLRRVLIITTLWRELCRAAVCGATRFTVDRRASCRRSIRRLLAVLRCRVLRGAVVDLGRRLRARRLIRGAVWLLCRLVASELRRRLGMLVIRVAVCLVTLLRRCVLHIWLCRFLRLRVRVRIGIRIQPVRIRRRRDRLCWLFATGVRILWICHYSPSVEKQHQPNKNGPGPSLVTPYLRSLDSCIAHRSGTLYQSAQSTAGMVESGERAFDEVGDHGAERNAHGLPRLREHRDRSASG